MFFSAKIKWAYLFLGLVLLSLSTFGAGLYRDSDIGNLAVFPFSFGLIFLLFFYLLGTESKKLIWWGIVGSVIIILTPALLLSYNTDGFNFNLINGISTSLLLLFFGSVLAGVGFIYMWLPYVFGLWLLGEKLRPNKK